MPKQTVLQGCSAHLGFALGSATSWMVKEVQAAVAAETPGQAKKLGKRKRQGQGEAAEIGARENVPPKTGKMASNQTPSASTTTSSKRKGRVFVDNPDVLAFRGQNIVSVDEPWLQLLDHLEERRIALVRAPPKSGKTMLGKLATLGLVEVVKNRRYEVRYCSSMRQCAIFVEEQGFPHVAAMAKHSGASAHDSTKNTVVYFFDEVGQVPKDIYDFFIKDPNGYAVFASTTRPESETGYVTPAELVQNSFFYKSPANRDVLSKWLAGRFAALFGQLDTEEEEVLMATRLLLGISNGHIGIIQYLGCKLEDAYCRNLTDVREFVQRALTTEQDILFPARCFGVANGVPTGDQCVLVSMLRCSGRLEFVDAHGCLEHAWNRENQEHRLGFVRGLYAPTVNVLQPLVPQEKDEDSLKIGFTHMLQPELYDSKFRVNSGWKPQCHEHRWVVNFSHSDTENAATKPTHVVDLVLSWLSNIATVDLVYANDKVDASEGVFQRSLHQFCTALGLKGKREAPVDGAGLRRIDLLVNSSMGIELLIRTRKDNRYTATKLLRRGSDTWNALLEHASRAQTRYATIAGACSQGYITVLPATLTTTTVEDEWVNFKALITTMQKDDNTSSALEQHILVAVAMPGWGEFTVFLHEPRKDPVKLLIPRFRLLFKWVGGELSLARRFYPKPKEVWVQQLLENGAYFRLAWSAFRVSPAEDSVESLAKAVEIERRLTNTFPLQIYKLNPAGTWWECISSEQTDHVLFANTKDKPYGFFVPK